jgi:asparagine synthetase B (glutamine-hydrolysing)
MKTDARSNQKDLNLGFLPGRSDCWEVRESPAMYFKPLVVHPAGDGKVYVQGTCRDGSGKELTIAEVGALIDKHGERVLDFLDGSFVMAVEDRDGVWCATDHSATLPLYYKLTTDELIVTTRPENMKADRSTDLDLSGILSSLNTGYPWGDLTLLKSWKVLRPGQILRLNKGNAVSIRNYFDPEVDPEVQGFNDPGELLREIDAGLIALASRYKKLLIPLSGGVDSRLISLQCHKLGIPFEAITFVANVADGDDYDIASRLVKIYNVKHHRWEWSPSTDCLENFTQLCISTGGTNDAYTTYPDGMQVFSRVASGFDCVLRGDHSFGFGLHSESLFQSAFELGMNYKEDLNWALRAQHQNTINLESVFEFQERVSVQLKGTAVNEWRHRSRRLTRNPRMHLPIGQLQAEHNMVAYPLLTRNIVKRMARTDTTRKNNKLIAHEALSKGSPPDIKRIPHSTRRTWQTGEPLLNLPKDILQEMVEIVSKPGILSDVINEPGVIEKFNGVFESTGKASRGGLGKSARQVLKKLLPKRMVHGYQERVSYPKTPSYMVFKRLFAVKVFIDSRFGR